MLVVSILSLLLSSKSCTLCSAGACDECDGRSMLQKGRDNTNFRLFVSNPGLIERDSGNQAARAGPMDDIATSPRRSKRKREQKQTRIQTKATVENWLDALGQEGVTWDEWYASEALDSGGRAPDYRSNATSTASRYWRRKRTPRTRIDDASNVDEGAFHAAEAFENVRNDHKAVGESASKADSRFFVHEPRSKQMTLPDKAMRAEPISRTRRANDAEMPRRQREQRRVPSKLDVADALRKINREGVNWDDYYAAEALEKATTDHITPTYKAGIGRSARLSEDGYQSVVECRSQHEMSSFVSRVIAQMELEVLNRGGFNDFVLYYSGVRDSQTFDRLLEELQSASEDACSWIAPIVHNKTNKRKQLSTNGRTAPLSETGYHAVARLHSPKDMLNFVYRLLPFMHMHVVREEGLWGFLPYFDCEKGMKSFKKLQVELKHEAAKPNPWVTKV